MFVGRYTVGVDKDGGFALPEDWRPFIGESRVVCLEMDEEYTCLNLIPESEIDKAPPNKERCEIHIGDDWKIKVPEGLRVQASLENEAVLTGSIRYARVWNPVCLDKESKDDGSPCGFHNECKEELFDAANAYAEKFGVHWILWWVDDPKEYLDRIEKNRPWTEEELAERDIEERKKRGMPFMSKDELVAELKGGCSPHNSPGLNVRQGGFRYSLVDM